MSGKTFNYDIVTLIELIETRNCIWDQFSSGYKDKNRKKHAWKEVFESLEPDFHLMDFEEQQNFGAMIMNKWQNIRDAFVRTLKTKDGEPSKKHYLYYNNLQFLLKARGMDSNASTNSVTDICDVTRDCDSPRYNNNTARTRSEHREASPRRKSRRLELDLEKEMMKVLSENDAPPKGPDEDEAFFLSILPTVRKLSDDDKLDFRMDVMALLKKYRNRSRRESKPLTSVVSSEDV